MRFHRHVATKVKSTRKSQVRNKMLEKRHFSSLSSLFTHIFTSPHRKHGFIGMRKTDVENTINSEFDVNRNTYAFSSSCCNKGQKARENHKSATKCWKRDIFRHFHHFSHTFSQVLTEKHGFIGMWKTDVENTINSELDVNRSTSAFSSLCCNKGQKARKITSLQQNV